MATYARALATLFRFRNLLWHGRAYFENPANGPEFRRLLIASGPVYIKLGQWMAHRPDMFPQEFLTHLASLQRSAPQHSMAETRRVIADAFDGRSIDDVFDEFAPDPLASGSIAQVYRARYRGRAVAVKVRHPNIEQAVRNDLELLRAAVNLAATLGNPYCAIVDIDRIMREMLAQCNLKHEATCLREMSENFSNNPLIETPDVLHADETLIIESFVDGVDYHDIGTSRDTTPYADDSERDECRDLCKKITLASFFQMMWVDAFVHGDLHSGNLLHKVERKPDALIAEESEHARNVHGDEWRQHVSRFRVRVCMLDFGIVVRLNEVQKEAIHHLITGLYAHHAKTVTDALARVAMQNNAVERSRFAAFANDMSAYLDNVDAIKKATKQIDIPQVMKDILKMVHRHEVRIDGNIVRMMVDFILIDEGRPHLAGNNLTDDTIAWVLYGDDGHHFPIVDHLMQIEAALFQKLRWDAGSEQKPEDQRQCGTITATSASRMRRYAAVESLAAARRMRESPSREDRQNVLAPTVRAKQRRRKRIALTAAHSPPRSPQKCAADNG